VLRLDGMQALHASIAIATLYPSRFKESSRICAASGFVLDDQNTSHLYGCLANLRTEKSHVDIDIVTYYSFCWS